VVDGASSTGAANVVHGSLTAHSRGVERRGAATHRPGRTRRSRPGQARCEPRGDRASEPTARLLVQQHPHPGSRPWADQQPRMSPTGPLGGGFQVGAPARARHAPATPGQGGWMVRSPTITLPAAPPTRRQLHRGQAPNRRSDRPERPGAPCQPPNPGFPSGSTSSTSTRPRHTSTPAGRPRIAGASGADSPADLGTGAPHRCPSARHRRHHCTHKRRRLAT
jgi:hypothetical protein